MHRTPTHGGVFPEPRHSRFQIKSDQFLSNTPTHRCHRANFTTNRRKVETSGSSASLVCFAAVCAAVGRHGRWEATQTLMLLEVVEGRDVGFVGTILRGIVNKLQSYGLPADPVRTNWFFTLPLRFTIWHNVGFVRLGLDSFRICFRWVRAERFGFVAQV